MAAPSVQARSAVASATSNATTFTPTLPTGSGGGLLAVVSSDENPTLTTASTDWVKIGQDTVFNSAATQAIFFKAVSTGSDTLQVDSTSSQQYSAVILRIDFAAGTTPTVGATFSNNNNTNGNPPLHSLSEARETLWVATWSCDGQNLSSGQPSGYADHQVIQGASAAGVTTETVEKTATASSEDPGAFTNTFSAWVVSTIAVYGISAGGAADMALLGIG